MKLLPYQLAWINDDARMKIVVKGRQTGYSFAATLRAVLNCLERRLTWIFLSKGERQSRLLMEKVADHARAIGAALEFHDSEFMEGTLIKQLEARFPNGSVIYGLPANPDTARGYTGNVTLDEFAFHQDAAKVYSALFPTITRGFGIEIISTPAGQQGKYFEIAKSAGLVDGYPREAGSPWSAHRVDIFEAVRQGLAEQAGMSGDQMIAQLRAGCEDEEAWLQEYCCQFLSDAANYIPMEMIFSCVSEQASTEWPIEDLRGKEWYLGIDIGRKRDLTIAWAFEKLGDTLWSRKLLAMSRVPFEEQEKAITDMLEAGPRRCSIDQSGLGMMLAERLARRYPMVEPVQFTAQVKERLAPLVKAAFENRTVRIPDNREIRGDINAVKRFVTPAGNIRFDAEHTDKGHADRFWALALALDAASQPAHHMTDAFLAGEPRAAEFELEPMAI